ncbi:MAG TPA: zinc metalloprotease HtpX, partial [bacterium]
TSSNGSYSGSSYRRRSGVGSNRLGGVILVLWAISGLGYLITKLISMAISRQREYLADADGVQMCKDPFALAESLYKISRRYRGDTPDTYSSLFIMNPSDSDLDDQDGFVPNLFSNHPPISKRLEKILNWAKADIETLKEKDEQEEKVEAATLAAVASTPGTPASFMTFRDNQWVGPFTPLQLLSMSFTNPATWVCPTGSQQVSKASDVPELLPLFQKQVQGSVSKNNCPRCKVPLVTIRYEGSEVENCTFCKGYLLRAGVLERLITREEVTFTPEEIKKAKIWRDSQKGPLIQRDHFPEIKCPYCLSVMCKGILSMLTQVVVDHCSDETCGAIWCDGGELETIQMLIEDAHKSIT